MTFDLERCLKEDGGKCRTRDGREARVICADAKGNLPIVVLISGGDYEVSAQLPRNGLANGNCDRPSPHSKDLVNLPRKLKCWVVMWWGPCGPNNGMSESFQRQEHAESRLRELLRDGMKPVIVPVEADEPA